MYTNTFKTDKFQFNINDILDITFIAGEKIMKIYNKRFEIEYKNDKSPLTEADKESNETIINGLKKIIDLPILSEEGQIIPYKEREKWNFFWMIDPLDGTKEFIKKNGQFTVNIALIEKNKPVFGIVYAPALNDLYFTDNKYSYKSNKELTYIKRLPLISKKESFVIVASKSHLNEETKNFIRNIKTDGKKKEFVTKGSSLKLCMVAEGVADIYPRLAPTMEWDTAAADAIVRKTGKMSYNFETGQPLKYNKKILLNPWFIVK